MSSTIFTRTKDASRALSLLDDARRNAVLLKLADAIVAGSAGLLEANAKDLAAMDRSNPLYDRLMLTEDRLKGIAADMRILICFDRLPGSEFNQLIQHLLAAFIFGTCRQLTVTESTGSSFPKLYIA